MRVLRSVLATLLLIVVACFTGVVSAAEYTIGSVPNVQLRSRYNFVSNPDGILSREAVVRIDSICYALRVSNIAQVAVVAVDQIVDSDGAKADPFTFAYDLFSEWGVGREGRDNGLGILFVGDQRQIRFVTGRGVEGVLPDAICKRVQTQYMLPYFRQGNFSAGMVSGVRVVESLLANSELNVGGSDYYPARGDSSRGLPVSSILLILACVIFAPMIVSLIALYRNSRCSRCGKFGLIDQSNRVVQRGDNFEIVEHTFVCPHCGNRETRVARELRSDLESVVRGGVIIGGGYGAARGFRRGGGFYGGGFGGGGFSGGGFGGGGFGGGGAGSGW
ncbi:MAG: TPM domain-containing protein [Rikenellaceae bacterium]